MPREAVADRDRHICPIHQEKAGLVHPEGQPTVFVGIEAMARWLDSAPCGPAKDFITSASPTVFVNGRPAARNSDGTLHSGTVSATTKTVFLDDANIARDFQLNGSDNVCHVAASGRRSGITTQSWGNCGCESMRQLIYMALGLNITEDAFLLDLLERGEANYSEDLDKLGGTTPAQMQQTLDRYGIATFQQEQSLFSVAQALIERRGVITSHYANILWADPGQLGKHAVLVTGLHFDQDGRITHVIANDTGSGECSRWFPAERFANSFTTTFQMVVTSAPTWR